MYLSDIGNKFTSECLKKAIVQFMVHSQMTDQPFCYCCTVEQLVEDYRSDDCNHCPCNDDMLLMVTLYSYDKTYPIEGIGLNDDIEFQDLMEAISPDKLKI